MSELSDRVADLLDSAVGRLVSGKKVAIAFSGGIDSGLIAGLAMRHASKVTLYTAGTEGSHDIEAAESAAELLGGDLRTIVLDDDTILDSIKCQIDITGTDSPLVLAFETPLYNVLRTCTEDTVLGGQGADEQFAGYQKYVGMKGEQLRDHIVEDLSRLYSETKPHEKKLSDHFSKAIGYPYLDRELSALVRAAPIDEIRPPDADVRKKVLCDAAVALGFGFLAERPKKAAQYGSGTMDSIRRICRDRNTTYNEMVSGMVRSLRQ
ncbi:Asparagine synthase (glutamine-hydrolyzing) [Thermoplasmatales archaeon BRNA1]|nr:Asparagine synthase (glutamine-hydrolyzing) [Thermoplasmatales archaeon BRNA1]